MMPLPRVAVLYAYEATVSPSDTHNSSSKLHDLSANPGEVFTVLSDLTQHQQQVHSLQWVRVRRESDPGDEGLLPTNYVKLLIPDGSAVGEAIQAYDCTGAQLSTGERDMNLAQGDHVVMLERFPNGWIYGRIQSTGVEGIVPENFLRRIDAVDIAAPTSVASGLERSHSGAVAKNEKKDSLAAATPRLSTVPAVVRAADFGEPVLRPRVVPAASYQSPPEESLEAHGASNNVARPQATRAFTTRGPKWPLRGSRSTTSNVRADKLQHARIDPVWKQKADERRRSTMLSGALQGMTFPISKRAHESSLNDPSAAHSFSASSAHVTAPSLANLIKTNHSTSESVVTGDKSVSPHAKKDSSRPVTEEPEETSINLCEHRGKTIIKAAPLNKLIEQISGEPIGTDFVTEYADTFLITYRTFTSPKEVLQQLVQTYTDCAVATTDPTLAKYNKNRRLRICNFLRRWSGQHFYDFEDDPELLEQYESFVASMKLLGQDLPLVAILEKSLAKSKQAMETAEHSAQRRLFDHVFSQPAPQPMIPKSSVCNTLFDTDPTELARQMTLIEFQLYREIRLKEFSLARSWTKKDLENTSPNLVKMIVRFNNVSRWVAKMIVECAEGPKTRAAHIVRFIAVARELLSLNNFNGVFEICSGLQSSAVHRLKKTWDLVRQKDAKDFAFYENELVGRVTSANQSFATYRDRLRTANPPCIPYLGVYQTDLTFIVDGNPDMIGTDINFFKRRLVAEVIKDVQGFQQKPYNLSPVALVMDWLRLQEAEVWPLLDDESIYEQSLLIEPRDGSEPLVSESRATQSGAVSSIFSKKSKSRGKGVVTANGSTTPHESLPATQALTDSPSQAIKLNKFFGVASSRAELLRAVSPDSTVGGNSTLSRAPVQTASDLEAKPPKLSASVDSARKAPLVGHLHNEPRRSASATAVAAGTWQSTLLSSTHSTKIIDPELVCADGPAFSVRAASIDVSILLQNDGWL